MNVIFAIVLGALLSFGIIRISTCAKTPDPRCPKLNLKHLFAVIAAIIGAIVYIELTKLGYSTITDAIHFVNIQIASVAPALALYGIWCPY
jgi:hypothetical protein